MKYFVCLAAFILVSSVAGQTGSSRPCSQNMKVAAIKGFTLGNTKTVIDSQLSPVWVAKNSGAEVAKVSTFDDKERFRGVKSLEFSVYENKVYSITIIYDSTVRLDNIGTFADDIAKSWKITEKWKGQGLVQIIECKERIAIVTSLRDLTIADTIVQKKIEKAEKAAERPFKP